MVSEVGLGVRALDGVHVPQGEGKFWEFFGPIGLNGVFLNRNVLDSYVKS